MEVGLEQQQQEQELLPVGADMVDGFVVPNMHTWFRQNSFFCTPDNGLLYHSRSDVNYISPLVTDRMPRVQILNVRATIRSLACSQDWTERREFATFDDTNNLQVWDLDAEAPVKGHKGHVYKSNGRDRGGGGGGGRDGPVNEVSSAICFTRTQKVLSTEHSLLIIYCLVADTYKMYADFFKPNSTVVLLSSSPDDRYVFAAGFRTGLIQMFSIKDMTILFNMRGHDKEVVSIDWMQVRVRPEESRASWRREERPKKEARKKKAAVEKEIAAGPAAADTSDIFDIYDYNENEEEFGTIVDKKTSSYDQQDRFYEKVHTTEGFNFLEECQNLKKDIIKAKEESEQEGEPDGEEKPPKVTSEDENELDDAEKLRDYIIVDGDGKEKPKSGSEEEPESEDVLRTVMMSGSRENTVYFWDYETGLTIDKISLPNTTGKRLSTGIFITAAWINQWKIVANTGTGHVFEWTVSFAFRGSHVRMQSKQNPVRYPVDMAVFLLRARAPMASFDPKCDYVWCQSMNRKILGLCVTGTPTIVTELTCLATGNMCVVESPLESTILAVACTDRKLVTVNLGTLAYNDVTCTPFMNKIGSKVTALDWHPETPDLIAFGTSEGRIGLLNTGNPNNVPVLVDSFLTTDVYALKWCELTDEFGQKITVLFATGKSKIAYYKKTTTAKPELIEMRQFGMVSSVSASGRYLLVGSQSGTVFVSDLTKNITQLYERNIARRYICSMQLKDDVLAVSSNENLIRLIDFTNGMDDKVEDNIRALQGHTMGVCSLRWGRGDSKLLVSASFDNTVRVWDTTTASCLAVYHNVDSVFCAIFSPIHDNIVILVGKGTTLAFVDYTKHPPAQDGESNGKKVKPPIKWAAPEERFDKKANRDKKRAGKPLSDLEKSIDSLRISEKPAPRVNGHAPTAPVQQPELSPITSQPTPSTSSSEVDQLSHRMEQVKFQEVEPPVQHLNASYSTLFHMSYRENNRPADVLACLCKLVNYVEPNEDYGEETEQPAEPVPESNERRYHLEKLFMAEKDLRELIDEETKNHHKVHTNSIGTLLLPQIGFRLKDEIINRIASKTLTDQLVALAPSISYSFWQKCCVAYALQLLEKKYPLASVPYFLASHKIDDAINHLCKHKYYREAWAVCKLRKAADDPIREQVCTEWAQYQETTGNLEGAALIWTAVKQYKNAIAVLSKRREITEDIKRAINVLNDKLQESAVVAQ